MFPERQIGPHREWRNEVEYLDALFDNGAAYTVGKMNGDHWLLYMTTPPEENEESRTMNDEGEATASPAPAPHMTASVASSATLSLPAAFDGQDYTLELLMTKLGAGARRPFLFLEEDLALASTSEEGTALSAASHSGAEHDHDAASKAKGAHVSRQLGIDSIFPRSRTHLDSYGFEPCGYSANALVDAGPSSSPGTGDEGYYTIHVTPEEGWSYASFECNVPVHPSRSRQWAEGVQARGGGGEEGAKKEEDQMPDLETLIQRVVHIFQPGHLTLTLFVSNSDSSTSSVNSDGDVVALDVKGGVQHGDHDDEPTSVEIAQRAFRHALLPHGYRRTDKINYEFGDYDLAFATFAKK